MSGLDWLSAIFLLAGAAFFLAGTVGLLRFPDIYTRLHALAKADNLGLGCIVIGLLFQSDSVAAALKLVLVWLLALAASATVSFLVARRAWRHGIAPWRADGYDAGGAPNNETCGSGLARDCDGRIVGKPAPTNQAAVPLKGREP